jgi:GAF domain-containing protein
MSTSWGFWLAITANLIGGLFCFALQVQVWAGGLRRRLSQSFSLVLLTFFVFFGAAVVARMSAWLEIGSPLFWTELAMGGVFLIGPALFAFSLAYFRSPRAALIVMLGFCVAALALGPPLLGHDLVTAIVPAGANALTPGLSPRGTFVLWITLVFLLGALTPFWLRRKESETTIPAIGTTALCVAVLCRLLLNISNLPFEFTFLLGILMLGYHVISRHVFNPLRAAAEQMEEQISTRAQELQRAKDRLERVNEHYRSVARIGREIAPLENPAELLEHLVNAIHDRFGYHHVYVYQPDGEKQSLTVKAAAGTTARTILDIGHRLAIGSSSLVSQVSEHHLPRIAEARGDEAILFGDTALPGCRSEMALPILAGDRLLGVLDLQSIHFEAFSEEDLHLMSHLVDQVAPTLHNTWVIQEMCAVRAELVSTQREHFQQQWQAGHDADHQQAFVYSDATGVVRASFDDVMSPEADRMVCSDGTLSVPILVRGQFLGAFTLERKSGAVWRADEIITLRELSERIGLAVEATRLSEENRRRAAREHIVSEVTNRIRETLQVDTMLRSATKEIRHALGLPEVTIRLTLPDRPSQNELPDATEGQSLAPRRPQEQDR